MAKILVDLGSYDGMATRAMWADFDRVYCWEPNPDLHRYYDGLPVHLIDAAAHSEDDTPLRLYRSNDGIMLGSSTFGDKTTGSIRSGFSIPVTAKRFATWLLARSAGYHVTVKMNIEGGEYHVLHDMLYAGATDVVDRLLIAWHHEKIPSITAEFHNNLVTRTLRAIPIVEEWRP